MSDAPKAVCPIKAHEREIDDETLKKVPELDPPLPATSAISKSCGR